MAQWKTATPAAPPPAPWKMAGAPSAAPAAADQWEDLGNQPAHPAIAASAITAPATAAPGAAASDDQWEDLGNHPAGEIPPPVKQSGMLGKAWKWANKGLVSGETIGNTLQTLSPSPKPADMQPGETIYQYLRRNQTSLDPDHPYLNAIKAGLSGAAADTMDTLSGFTSPASIALAGAGAAGRVPGAIGKVAKAAQLAGAGTFATKGAMDVADVATQPGNASPDDLQKMFFGGAQLAGGMAGAGDAVAGSSPKTGVSMMNRVIKPGLKNLERGMNPGQAVIDEGITGNSTADLGKNIKARYRMVGQQIGDTLTAPAAAAQKLDVHSAVSQPIDDAMATAQNAGRADLYSKLQTIKDQLTKNFAPDVNGNLQPIGPITKNKALVDLTPEEVTDIKRQVGDVTKWEGTPYRDEFNQVKASIYGNLKDAVEQAVPDVAPLNARYRMLKNAGSATERTAAIHERHAAVSLPDYVLSTAGGAAGLAMGHTAEGAALGVGSMLAKKALASPAFQTRAAQLLAHEAPGEAAAGAPIAAGAQQPKWRRKKP